MSDLLPAQFDTFVSNAVRTFWQGQNRGVDSRVCMEGFQSVLRAVAHHAGLPLSSVIVEPSQRVLPGYFRATHTWDALVVHEGQLLGAFMFTAQVGAFEQTFDSIAEEAVGCAADLWKSFEKGAFQHNEKVARPPFLGWLMMLEEGEELRAPVKCQEPQFKVFSAFKDAPYAQRYRLLFARVQAEKLYERAAVILSKKEDAALGSYHGLSTDTSIRAMFLGFAAHTKEELSARAAA